MRNPGESIDDGGSEDRKEGAASELSSSSGPAVAPDEGVGDSDKESATATPPSSLLLSTPTLKHILFFFILNS